MRAPQSDPLAPMIQAALAAGLPVPADLLEPPPDLGEATLESLYLRVRDGVRLAVDVWLPKLQEGQKVTTAIRSTRYWRARIGDPILERLTETEAARWTASGFALVLLDARGTGASFGTWSRPWDDDQRDDLYELVDWVIAQPWSDGTVGGFGTSYDGTTAHLLASTGHPAVKAVVPRFALFDPLHHIASPGGVPLDWFIENWNSTNWHLDGHPDRATAPPLMPLNGRVRPVAGEEGALAAVHEEHAANWDLWENGKSAECREDLVAADGKLVEEGCPIGRIEQLRASGVPIWLWTSWFDGAYSAAALAQLADPDLDVRVTIGPWSHGAGMPTLGDPFNLAAKLEPGTP